MKTFTLLICLLLTACGIASADNVPQPVSQSVDPCAVETGTFPIAAQGFVEPQPTGTVSYTLMPCAHVAYLFFPILRGESNSTSFTLGPLPSFLIPQTIPRQSHMIEAFDQSVEKYVAGLAVRAGDGQIVLGLEGQEQGWSATGEKGFGEQLITLYLQ